MSLSWLFERIKYKVTLVNKKITKKGKIFLLNYNTNKVTRWVSVKIAQNVAKTIFAKINT
jgi:hypothetical protein